MKKLISLLLCLTLVLTLAIPASASLTLSDRKTMSYLGGTYSGPVNFNMPQGQGTLDWGKCSYVGNFEDGYPYGSGTFYYANGECHYSSQWDWAFYYYCTWVEGRQGADMFYYGMLDGDTHCGYGTLDFNAGGSFTGEFVDGDPEGWGIYTYRNPKSEKNREKESDEWKTVYGNNRLEHKYTGLKIGKKWQGFGIGIKKSGYAYCGEIKDDYRDGHGELYTKKDKLETSGIYRSGKLVKADKK